LFITSIRDKGQGSEIVVADYKM